MQGRCYVCAAAAAAVAGKRSISGLVQRMAAAQPGNHGDQLTGSTRQCAATSPWPRQRPSQPPRGRGTPERTRNGNEGRGVPPGTVQELYRNVRYVLQNVNEIWKSGDTCLLE